MRFAYADPPYLGCGGKYKAHHAEAHIWNTVGAHDTLIQQLVGEYPDGWALSCHTPSLHTLLPLCPADTRIAAWVKPFAVFRPGVNPAYAWEPVLFRGGRKRDRYEPTVRDWHSENITLKKGLVGVKPPGFNAWILNLLGVRPEDTLDDLFPGQHGMSVARAAVAVT